MLISYYNILNQYVALFVEFFCTPLLANGLLSDSGSMGSGLVWRRVSAGTKYGANGMDKYILLVLVHGLVCSDPLSRSGLLDRHDLIALPQLSAAVILRTG